jgi:ABC-2 type transport system ATP-binding protein
MSPPALEVRSLEKVYGDFRAVDHISFLVPRGTVVGLLGPNGAGKTTTIQMLLGVTEKTSGAIAFFGTDLTPKTKQACLQRINYTSAYSTLQGRITVRENLLSFAYLYSVPNPKRRVDEMSDLFDLRELMNQRFWGLSAGQKTRVNLAKALLNDPELLLMDEPTASLDPDVRDRTMAMIERLREERGLSILYTSHNMDEVARICDDVIFLDRGRIVKQDTPQNLTAELQRTSLIVSFRNVPAHSVSTNVSTTGLPFRFDAEHTATVDLDVTEVPAVLERITAVPNIEISDIEIRKANLEDVFLDLTRSRDVLAAD